MTKPIHLLVPMSGQGKRYQAAGYPMPKPLVPVSGQPMLARLLQSFPTEWPTHFVMAENHLTTDLPGLCQRLRPSAQVSTVPVHSEGPSKALLEGIRHVSDDAPVFVSYCDYGMVWDASAFQRFVESSACDICVVCYRGFHPHYLNNDPYAYCRMSGERIVEIKEKGSFTDQRENEFASAGGYYFRSVRLLKQAIELQKNLDLKCNGEFYTSLTCQALLQSDLQIDARVFEIPYFFQWGTPRDLQDFEYWEKSFHAYQATLKERAQVEQVLMPMAGLGFRFTNITSLPKPLIPLDGTAMFSQALATLPHASKTVLVALNEFSTQIQFFAPTAQVISLAKTPAGQALSTEAGLPALNLKQPVLVSSCDHGIVLNPQKWKRFRHEPACDAAIFTVRGYPGARRRPTSYAYVLSEGGHEFPLVKGVSVKVPVSDKPAQDSLLVGTFWFRSVELLQLGINELKKQGRTVNGELYLDSVFEVLMAQGHIVREIELDGYLCWGDPDSLAETIYWHEVFMGHTFQPRPRFPGVQHG